MPKPWSVQAPIHPEGWRFVGPLALATVALTYLFGVSVLMAGALITLSVAAFFRNPRRITPTRAGLVIGPADGRVVAVKEVTPEPALGLGEEPRVRISIFLSVLNVHVNRSPVDGTVTHTDYRPGVFVNAAFDKASEKNERSALALRWTGDHPRAGQTVGVVQIAGLIARRIVTDAHEGQSLQAGERFGLIRFGSRTDVYLPQGLTPLVSVGQRVVGGETVLADARSDEPTRVGEAR